MRLQAARNLGLFARGYSPRYVATSSLRLKSTFDTPEGTTLSRQGDLQRYGVPDLSDTLNKFVQSSKPFLSKEEMKTTIEKVEAMKKSDGVAQKCQELLKKKAAVSDNWLAQWWLDLAYLSYRDPVIVWSSPGFVWPKQNFKGEDDRLEYSARILTGILDYKVMLDKECLPVEMMGKQPMDMLQYYRVFGTTRIPGPQLDGQSFVSNSTHIVVMHDNNMFKLTTTGKDGKTLSTDQLFGSLKYIVKQSKEMGRGVPVGILTSENRDRWNEAFEILTQSSENKQVFDEIRRAQFLLCLDPDTSDVPAADDLARGAMQAIHGFGADKCSGNRWFDKTIQIFVGESGHSGMSYEHSPAEGVALMNIINHVLNVSNGGNRFSTNEKTAELEPPTALKFKDLDKLDSHIATAQNNLNNLAQDLSLNPLHFKAFGKNFIKTQQCSPDSFLQMAFQYTFYRLHNTPAGHYESGGLRTFKEGRTDIIRSCSVESVAFAQKMLDNSASTKDRYDAMMAAIRGHSAYAKMTVSGGAVDRHLLGIKLTAKEEGLELPELYEDPAFTRSTYHRLSTSQVSGTHEAFLCFGPLVMDGYGVCYNIRERDLIFGISCMNSHPDTDSLKFKNALQESLGEMHDLCNMVNQNAKL